MIELARIDMDNKDILYNIINLRHHTTCYSFPFPDGQSEVSTLKCRRFPRDFCQFHNDFISLSLPAIQTDQYNWYRSCSTPSHTKQPLPVVVCCLDEDPTCTTGKDDWLILSLLLEKYWTIEEKLFLHLDCWEKFVRLSLDLLLFMRSFLYPFFINPSLE